MATTDTQSFSGHQYQLVLSGALSLEQARTQAAAAGGYLVNVGSKEENDFLISWLKTGSANFTAGSITSVWLGASDATEEGAWRWDNGDRVLFGDWGSGLPDDSRGAEDGAMLELNKWLVGTGDLAGWNDVSTGSTAYLVIEVGNSQARPVAVLGSDGGDVLAAGPAGLVEAGSGNDTVGGGALSDLIDGQAGNDLIAAGAGNDTLYGGTGNDQVQGETGNDSIFGGSGDDKLFGQDGADVLFGNEGNDSLYGGLGNDRLFGGAGNDLLDGGEQRRLPWTVTTGDYDRADYSASAGIRLDLNTLSVSVVGESGTDTLKGIEEVQGGRGVSDLVTGRLSATAAQATQAGTSLYLWLQGGSDTVTADPMGYQQVWSDGVTVGYHWSATPIQLAFTLGNTAKVTYTASGTTQVAGVDTLVNVGTFGESAYSDRLDFSVATRNHLGYATDPLADLTWHTVLMGYGGNDTVIGNGQTTLNFGAVSGTVNGGSAGLTIDLAGSADALKTVSLANLLSSTSKPLGTLSFQGVRTIHGTRFNDTLLGGGNDGFESFRGDVGDDFIDGRSGYDRADYRGLIEGGTVYLADGYVESATQGADTLRSIEAVRGSMFDDTYYAKGFVGGDANQDFNVGSIWWGLNEFSGEGGDDRVSGNGATRLNYESSMLAMRVDLAAGVADARNEADQSTEAYRSVGRDTFTDVFSVYGSAFDDELLGGGAGLVRYALGGEYFRGNAGNDRIEGRGGRDYAVYTNSPGAIYADMRLPSGQVQDGWGYVDTLVDVEVIYGSTFDDTVVGSVADEALMGERGADRLQGNEGLDKVIYHADAAGVTIKLGGWVGAAGTTLPAGWAGSARDGWGTVDLFSGVEGAEGSNYADLLVGDTGDNRLDGRGGNDTIDGGDGSDWAEYDQANYDIQVDLSQGKAFDDGQFVGEGSPWDGVESDVLLNIENVLGGFGNDLIVGDEKANVLKGGGGNDTLKGSAGNDVALYNGLLSQYDIRAVEGGWQVSDLRLEGHGERRFDPYAQKWIVSDGIDRLESIETLRFADGYELVLANQNVVQGSDQAETIAGGATNDLLYGQGGNDVLRPGAGNDLVNGGDQRFVAWLPSFYANFNIPSSASTDFDTLDYSTVTGSGGIRVTLDTSTVTYAGTGTDPIGIDQYTGIEIISGTSRSDEVLGKLPGRGSAGEQNILKFVGNGGSDTVTLASTLNTDRTSLGVQVSYAWASGVVLTADADGSTLRVSYGSGAAQGVDTLKGVIAIEGSPGDDQVNFTGYKTNVQGYYQAAFAPNGGSDTVVGNGGSLVVLTPTASSTGAGATVDLLNGSADLSHLSIDGRSYGTLTYSGLWGVWASNWDDSLSGNSSNNYFRGRAGNDFIDGRGGYDVADYRGRDVAGPIQVALAQGVVVGDASIGTDTLRSIEEIRGTDFGDVYDARGFSSSSVNASSPGYGNRNFFQPQGGDDTVIGNGDTQVNYGNVAMFGIEVDLRQGFADALNPSDRDTAAWATMGRDVLVGVSRVGGSVYADRLTGGGAGTYQALNPPFEYFEPNAGDDTVDGGGGIDMVDYSGSGQALFVDMNLARGQAQGAWGSTDTLISIENIQGTNYSDVFLGSDTNPSTVFASEGFDGRNGADWIAGRGGLDAVLYTNDPKGVTVYLDKGSTQATRTFSSETTFTLSFEGVATDGYDSGNTDYLSGIEQVEGSNYADKLYGGAGDERFDGRGGNDTIDGGAGNDWVEYNNAWGGATVTLGEPGSAGSALDGFGGSDQLLNIENVLGSLYDDSMTGNSSDNLLQGGGGNDTLDGLGGSDSALYKGGRDRYVVTPTTDGFQVRDLLTNPYFDAKSGEWVVAEGTDTLRNIESLRFGDGSTLSLTGWATISGGAGNDTLGVSPNTTNDLISGGAGNDALTGDGGNDWLVGGDGNDVLRGGDGGDVLEGGLGDDTFYPGAGDDLIQGGEQRSVYWLQDRAGDRDTLNYSDVTDGGIQVDLSAAQVTGPASVGTDRYSGIEQITGTSSTDVLTGLLGALPDPAAQHQISFSGSGGSDVIAQDLYGNEPWFNGVVATYGWSQTPITASFAGTSGTVVYGSAGTQAAGVDQLVRVLQIVGTRYSDSVDFSGATEGQLQWRKDTYFAASGGSDTVSGNGATWIGVNANATSTSAAGAQIDLTRGSADLSNLSSFGAALGTLTYSGVYGLVGTSYNDTLSGGVYDVLENFRGQGGNDWIDGRGGFDRADYRPATEAITVNLAVGEVLGGIPSGTDTLRAVEAIRATMFADTYNAAGFGASSTNAGSLGSFNAIEALGGDDTIIGNGATRATYEFSMLPVYVDLGAGYSDALSGADKLSLEYLSLGRDTLSGVYSVRGSVFGDALVGGGQGRIDDPPRWEEFEGGDGNDLIDGRGGYDVATYANDPARIWVDMNRPFDQVEDGYGKHDTLRGIEQVSGTKYNDILIGRDDHAGLFNAQESFEGREGSDYIAGRGGYNEVLYVSDPSGVTVILDSGTVQLEVHNEQGEFFQARGYALDGWGDKDYLADIGGVEGSAFADKIVGDAKDNRLDGRAGNDTLDGGLGSDWAEYNNAPSGITVDLSTGQASDGYGSTDTLISLENVQGSGYADQLTGTSAANVFEGMGGNDTLRGGGGMDVALYRGLQSDYTVSKNADGSWQVADKRSAPIFDPVSGTWTWVDGTDTLFGIESARFADGSELQLDPPPTQGGGSLHGIAYHWKSHALLQDVTVNIAGLGTTQPAGNRLMSLRDTRTDAQGDLLVDLWVDSAAPVSNFNVDLSFDPSRTLAFTWDAAAIPPQQWVKQDNLDAVNGELNLVAVCLTERSGSFRVGTIELSASAAASGFLRLAVADGKVNNTLVSPFGVSFGHDLTGSDGVWAFDGIDFDAYAVRASKAVTEDAIDSADVLAALKIAVGRNPNADPDGAGPASPLAVSPYQFIAADVNADSRVDSADALALLKMAVGRSDALAPEWLFVREDTDFWNEAATGGPAFSTTRKSVVWEGQDKQLAVQGSTELNLVGLIKGDVDGSWRPAAANAPALSTSYFQSLGQELGVPLDQWGVYLNPLVQG